MDLDRINELLIDFGLTEIYFGSEGFRLLLAKEIPEGQLGYSKHPDGSDLTGTSDGDWKREWIVIGYDTSVGDPYFVDTNDKNLPVFTAMHGMGSWEPVKISVSLERFLSCLKHLAKVSPVDHSRIDPDQTTITDEKTLSELEKKLSELAGEGDFWSSFFARHRDWIEESDC